jgi:hypothetical protein
MKQKLIKSALISLGGVVIAFLATFTPALVAYVQNGTPIDWATLGVIVITGVSAWLVNTIKELIKYYETVK